ncbi:unnamed protein product, partial [Brassica oleracea]
FTTVVPSQGVENVGVSTLEFWSFEKLLNQTLLSSLSGGDEKTEEEKEEKEKEKEKEEESGESTDLTRESGEKVLSCACYG